MNIALITGSGGLIKLCNAKIGLFTKFITSATKQNPIYKIFFLLFLTILILFLRRPSQFLHPYIWDEEGTQLLSQYLNLNLFDYFITPINGYLITSSKLLFALSVKISFLNYPSIAAFMAFSCIALVIITIAFSPTILKFPFLCALAALCIKTDPECYGVLLYSFWWVGILGVLALLWNFEEKRTGLRILFIVVATLSSPMAVALIPFYIFRLLKKSTPVEFISFGVAVSMGFIQYLFGIKHQIATELASQSYNFDFFKHLMIKFFGFNVGYPFVSNVSALFIIGIIVCMYVCMYVWKNKSDTSVFYLTVLFVASIALVLLRVNIFILDPLYAGPRYFFYSSLFFSWLVVSLLSHYYKSKYTMVRFVFIIILLSNFMGISISRKHDYINFKQNFEKKIDGNYLLAIHFAGDKNSMWHYNLSEENYQKLINNSLIK